jgi:hypothetical protein
VSARPLTKASNDLRDCALEAARDLLLEHNDAPVGIETLLRLMYIRAFRDGVQTANAATTRVLADVCGEVSGTLPPHSHDSYLPDHIVEQLAGARRQAGLLDAVASEVASHV